ncbi:hypothetical protein DLAC_07631 [Tieghemostelium lacteum]|uniref:Ribosome biogenesis protein NOP53 n=1 Tax=Tieghemostelium lacteum TaxID=361077 RepID=A0A151ZD11_TIELA|nr:hypothetical protein DLAC_07631 [Tieghemostelium lacteum]|eukprot:KYQ91830.1 hypothetical protein DLAC_07631 [Tieghemostelium lacteum]
MVHKKSQKQRKRVDAYKLTQEAHEKEIQDQLKFGKPAEKKSDKELFVIDKKGTLGDVNDTLKKEYTLSSDRILAPNPNVEIVSKDTEMKQESKDKTFMHDINNKSRFLKKHAKQYYDNKANANNKNQKRKLEDLWSVEAPVIRDVKEKIQKLDPEIQPYLDATLEDTKKLVVPSKTTLAKPLARKVKSVAIPEPGLSYNPDPEEHLDVLAMEKVKKIKEADEIKFFERSSNPKTRDFDASKYLNQKSQKDLEELERKEKEYEASLQPYQHEDKERITKKEKNKKLRRVEYQNKLKQLAEDDKFNKQIDQSEAYLQEIKEKEEKDAKERELRNEKKQQSKFEKTQKVGQFAVKHTYEPVLNVNELPKSLINLSNVKHNPLKERYLTLQKRNIIEGSGKKSPFAPLPWVKTFTKNSWKNTTSL